MTSYSDLHCHPSLYGFNRLRNGPRDGDPEYFNPWYVPGDVDHGAMARGARGSAYPQCTLPMLADSRTRLVYASITPIEKGFLVPGEQPRFSVEMLKLVTGTTLLSSAGAFVRGRRFEAGRRVTGLLRSPGPVRRALQQRFLGYSAERLAYMQSDAYDYWDEFNREYQYWLNADGESSSGALTRGDGSVAAVEGRYHLIEGGEHLDDVLATRRDLAALLTIEGAHTFSVGPDGRRVPDDVLFERVDALRALPHRIHSVTLAHHFDNGLCGHAHSLPDAAGFVMDQSERMEADFEPIGLRVVRELLDVDGDLRPRGGQRIHIDCKHMSPRSRRTYYSQIVRPHNEWARAEGAPLIPVITSHSAFNGIDSLDEVIANLAREDDHWHRPPFLAWGINHCADDVREVFASRGMIGLVFDTRVLGVPPRQRIDREHWARVLANHVFATADVILADERIPLDERRAVWDCICLGTDYDGLIDPLTAYPTVLAFDELRADLCELFDEQHHTRGISDFGVENLVDKIMWRNAVDFARRTLR